MEIDQWAQEAVHYRRRPSQVSGLALYENFVLVQGLDFSAVTVITDTIRTMRLGLCSPVLRAPGDARAAAGPPFPRAARAPD